MGRRSTVGRNKKTKRTVTSGNNVHNNSKGNIFSPVRGKNMNDQEKF